MTHPEPSAYCFDVHGTPAWTVARRAPRVFAPFVPEAALRDLAGFTVAGGTTGRPPATPHGVVPA